MEAFQGKIVTTGSRDNDLFDILIMTPCGHNFSLKCFQKWIRLGKCTYANYHSQISSKMTSLPQISSTLVTAIRMAKMSKSNATSKPPKVYHFVYNHDSSHKTFITGHARKWGKEKENAYGGKILSQSLLIILDQFLQKNNQKEK